MTCLIVRRLFLQFYVLNGKQLDLLEEKLDLLHRLNGKGCFRDQRILILEEEVRSLRAEFRGVCQEARSHKDETCKATCAFVTFADQEGKEVCR